MNIVEFTVLYIDPQRRKSLNVIVIAVSIVRLNNLCIKLVGVDNNRITSFILLLSTPNIMKIELLIV